MSYISFSYYILVAAAVLIYYCFPKKARWFVLLAASAVFYWQACADWQSGALLGGTIVVSYLWSLLLARRQDGERKSLFSRILLLIAVLTTVGPLLLVKLNDYAQGMFTLPEGFSIIVPLGLSFYSLQIVAYLSDVSDGKCKVQRNPLKYALFISFFPQIIQGPIARYNQLEDELFAQKAFDEKTFVHGFQLIIWGFFLKMMIADKAATVVNAIYGNAFPLGGAYLWVAAILYAIQLYTDFMACVTLSRGVACLFGIAIPENFARPYLATSIKDFWRRWHISLSTWLRDYIYIPLGGNRHGVFRKYVNLLITFLVSGFWHGGHLGFLLWGLLHAVYQIAGDLTAPLRTAMYRKLRIDPSLKIAVWWRRTITFLLVTLSWVIFSAGSISTACDRLQRMFTVFNPWLFFDDSLLGFGLELKEWGVLAASILLMIAVSVQRERGHSIGTWIARQALPVRWSIYIIAIVCIWVLSTYGYGFNAADFIYGGF